MKTHFLFFLIFLYGLKGLSQHSISGNFMPATDFKWLIVYELTPESQRYVDDTAIKEGYFKLELPENTETGMYRIVYAVPQDEFYIDVIYNGEEDIEFNFNLEDGINIIASEENKIYYDYFTEIAVLEHKLTAFYEAGNTSKNQFKEITKQLSEVQTRYEKKGTDLLVHKFIKGNSPYIPDGYEDFETYSSAKKKRYFDILDINDILLQSSGFLKEKLSNFVFSQFSSNVKSNEAMQSAILANVDEVSNKLSDIPLPFKTAVFYNFWKTAHTNTLYTVSDAIFNTYLKDLATENGNQALIDEVELSTRLRIGTVSPEISWMHGDKINSLSGLQGAEKYVLVFWSSTCSHCLKELPSLHTALTKYEQVTVVAVGLEDDDTNWIKEITSLPNFEHAIGLGKWESDYAQLFGIQQTPTYFILDKDKRFVAFPENDREVVALLNKD